MQLKSITIIFICLFVSMSSCKENKAGFDIYQTEEFSFKGRDARVVIPNKKHDNAHWIWRARFWGHEPQLDLALLEKGFHVVYVDVADLFGNQEAVDLWDQFYKHCLAEYELNPKVVLEGMSRGGLIIYNWASQNTDKVFCIYADAPVCDIKSWPGGLYEGVGSPAAWKTCLAAHNLDSVSVMSFEKIPINTCVNVAKAGIPVIHVYGESDSIVPHTENTDLLAAQFKAAGGHIELIGKEGVGHHPHSLEDPTPILNFVMKSLAN